MQLGCLLCVCPGRRRGVGPILGCRLCFLCLPRIRSSPLPLQDTCLLHTVPSCPPARPPRRYGDVWLGRWHGSDVAVKSLNPSLFFGGGACRSGWVGVLFWDWW